MTERATRRWYGVASVAFLSAAAGIIAGRPGLLLVSVIGIAYAAYPRLTTAPTIDLEVDRTVDADEPAPGDPVRVTVSIHNQGGLVTDLRVIDGVPEALAVTDGSPRHGTALRAGKTAVYRYTVEAKRGVHAFTPLTVLARDASGAIERETQVEAETTIRCIPELVDPSMTVPLRAQTAQYTGAVASDVGGSGTEFYATRNYRPGDAMTRIDWNRLARTGELSTVDYREERMATVVLAIDARVGAYQGGDEHALNRSVEAAGRIAISLLDAGHRVGIAAFGSTSCWLAPNTGSSHREAIRTLLATHPALSPIPPTDPIIMTQRARELRRRLPANAQIFLFSPLADDYVVAIAGQFEAHGHALTVVSPDVTVEDTPGRTLSRIERRLRIDRLRASHIPVIDWRDGSIERAIERNRSRR